MELVEFRGETICYDERMYILIAQSNCFVDISDHTAQDCGCVTVLVNYHVESLNSRCTNT